MYDMSDLRALVVDDNVHMCRLIRAMLGGFGIRDVIEANDGADAIERLNTNAIDLLIIDWEMPVLDGSQLVRLIRKPDHPLAYVPIIMITGYSTETRAREAMRLGVNDILLKPCSSKALYQRIVDTFLNPRPFLKTDDYFGPKPRLEIEKKPAFPTPSLEDLTGSALESGELAIEEEMPGFVDPEAEPAKGFAI